MITLSLLGRDRFDDVSHIAVAPEQEPFCGSIASHFAADEPSCDFHAVRLDGVAVGFFKIDRDYAARMNLACPKELGLRGVMIDRAQQGRGIGKAAMAQLRRHLRQTYPDARTCVLTVNTINAAARATYLSAGFRDEGQLYLGGNLGPQHVLRLDLRPADDTIPAVAPCSESEC
ncbi:GNAT family N-acetyltransferase [Paracoccus rhizosphaerae]|uniref:GNAT family N-acetyltransferase n=1 Tax=Paracoccus rhizosphaerae TaxID=1133347 RepID=A0ABV6CEG2_9RHOB|nr:GNAT family N-acetyltransferase [Paracoccus rhizosphaerae]